MSAIETAVNTNLTYTNGATGPDPFTMSDNAAGNGKMVAADINGPPRALTPSVNGTAGDVPVTNLAVNPPKSGVDVSTSGGTDAKTGLDDAVLGGGTNDGGGLTDNVTFQVSGSVGTQVYSFNAGATLAQIISAINANTDSTGVSAAGSTGTPTRRPATWC